MDINIVTLSYLFFRLAPFIIVCYFSLSSIFNQDIKGLIYLAGLLITCTIAHLFSTIFEENPNAEPVCSNFTFNGVVLLGSLHLGISALCYTFFYLLFVIVKHNLVLGNLPTIIIFPILIAGDMAWNMSHKCFKIVNILFSIVLGGSLGLLWGWTIDSLNNPNLLYINTGGSQTVCSRPAKQLFKCTMKSQATISPTTPPTL